MNTSYHRPTHTFEEGAYNASQVRLYGIHHSKTVNLNSSAFELGNYSIKIEPIEKSKEENDEKPEEENNEKLKGKNDKKNVEVEVNFVRINQRNDNQAVFMSINFASSNRESKKKDYSIGIIYGYAYEGHCYDLPKPAIMLLPVSPDEIPKNDCGYTKKAEKKYKVWVVDKLDKCDHIEFSSGFVEQLVLEANLPGRRSPSMYSANMQLAHRGGRLNE